MFGGVSCVCRCEMQRAAGEGGVRFAVLFLIEDKFVGVGESVGASKRLNAKGECNRT